MDTVIIPIGCHCSPAAALIELNLRTHAYPFDWLRAPMHAVLTAFTNPEFEHFMKKEELRMGHNHKYLIDRYGFEYPHDFPNVVRAPAHVRKLMGEDVLDEDFPEDTILDNWMDSYEMVKQKYDRRINRLIDALKSDKQVILVRHYGATVMDMVVLRDIIKTRYPGIKLKLVLVDTIKHDNMNEKDIFTYQLDDSVNWNDLNRWKEIYADLGILG